jgi:hypothetical protein
MQDDVESTWIPTWHRMDYVSWVIWIIFKNHLLKVGLTQNRETMLLQMLKIIDYNILSCVRTRVNRNSSK